MDGNISILQYHVSALRYDETALRAAGRTPASERGVRFDDRARPADMLSGPRILGEDMMKNRLSGLLFLSACLAAGFVQAEGKSSPVPDVAAAGVRAHSAKTDAMHQSGIDFHCELGNKLTVYEHEGEKDRIGLRWNKQMHDLTRVQTTTGANRFENKQSGLVWISIPGKSMLLDSQKGRQLANECRTTEQLKGMKSKT